jgi:hypothetical protein
VRLAVADFYMWQALRCRISKDNYYSRLKSQQARLWPVFKALSAALRNLLASWSKGFELTGFQKLWANGKSFWHYTAKKYHTSVV